MAVFTGTGVGNTSVQTTFDEPYAVNPINGQNFGITSSLGFGSVVISGNGFTYSSTTTGGVTTYQVTGGTITSLGYGGPTGGQQTWTGLNVSAVAAFNALGAADIFNSLFFSGDDTFNWSAGSNVSALYGLGGNDTFNIGDWDAYGGSNYQINGGDGNDTINITGGVGHEYSASYNPDQSGGNVTDFAVTGVETVKLGAGANYLILARSDLALAGTTVTIDGSALGPSDRLVFNTNGAFTIAGNLVVLGGAGNDVLEGGTGTNIFNGGSGNNTVDFMWGQQRGLSMGVTADLSNTGAQNFGTGWGTGTFINIQNLIGTPYSDTLTGDANDNVFTGEAGNDTINGGAGFDTAVFSGAFAAYSITHSGTTTTVSGPDGTDALTSVELGKFSDRTVQISGPVLTTADTRIAAGQSVALSSLFSVNDLNGQPITEYQLWDSTSDPNSGYFTVDGAQQPAHTIITISAAQLAQTRFVSGTDNSNLQIRAYDGTSWSASDTESWAPFSAGAGDNPPVVTTSNISGSRNQTFALSSLFSVSDADGDTMTQYQLWDSNGDPNSGYFTIDGVAQAAHMIITVSAAQLSQTDFVTGKVSDSLQIRAYDGYQWSAADNAAWAPFTVSVPADNAPVVRTSDITKAAGQALPLSSLVSVSDVDGDPITEYQLWDSTRYPGAGYWTVDGVAQPAGQVITISAAQAAQTTFVTGTTPTSLQVRASDGILWSAPDNSAWSPFTVHETSPIVTTSNLAIVLGTTVTLSSLFSAIDPDGDAITDYQLWDSTRDPNAGYFTINGVAQPAGTVLDVSAAQLSQTAFVAGTVATALQIRAYDGNLWSAPADADWSPFTVSPPLPVVTTTSLTEARGQTLALSSLFSVSDANGLSMTKYELWDSTRDPNAGYFTINGVVQPASTVIDITAAQLAQTSFVTGMVATSLQIRAFDALNWSAADNASWAPFTINPPVNYPPVVDTTSFTARHGQTIAFTNLFGVSDANGDTITQYQAWDSTRDPNSGHFVVDGVVQPAGTEINISAAQAATATFVTGSVGDALQIRAYDSQAWSAPENGSWSPFTITVPPNSPPIVTTSDINTTAGQSLTLSNMFSVSDADGDTMTKYELWDSTRDPNSGHFVVNGVAQSAGTIIDITATQLSQTSFLTGTAGDALQIRAFDGYAWSAADNANWSPFHINIS